MISLSTARRVLVSPRAAEALPPPLVDQLAAFACERLQIETLEARGLDRLDFADVHVAAVLDLVARVYALAIRDLLEPAP